MNHFKRILVLGAPGSGKSALSLELAEKFNLELIVLDHYYWSKDWSPLPLLEFRKICAQLAQKGQWVMDGNFGSTLNERLPHADLVIFLTPSPWISCWRQFLRSLGIGRKISRPQNCPERFNRDLFWLTYKFNGAHGKLLESKIKEEYPNTPLIKIKKGSALFKHPHFN